jgi:hypothetical protein
VLVSAREAEAIISALADPQALLVFGVIVASTSKARVRDQYGNPPIGTSYITPFGLMRETSLSRAVIERAAERLKAAGLLEVIPPDERGFESWRVSEAAMATAAADGLPLNELGGRARSEYNVTLVSGEM